MLNYQRVNSMILPAIYLKGKAPACMSSIVFLYVGLCVFLSVYLSFSLARTQIISFPSVFL